MRLPATTAALRVLYQILVLEGFDDGKIGRPSFSTQTQLDELVRKWKEVHQPYQVDLKELDL